MPKQIRSLIAIPTEEILDQHSMAFLTALGVVLTDECHDEILAVASHTSEPYLYFHTPTHKKADDEYEILFDDSLVSAVKDFAEAVTKAQ